MGAAADDKGGDILFLGRDLPIVVGLFGGDGEHFLADGQAGEAGIDMGGEVASGVGEGKANEVGIFGEEKVCFTGEGILFMDEGFDFE